MKVTLLTSDDTPRYRELMLHAYEHAADALTSTPEERAAEPESWWIKRIGGPQADTVAFGAFSESELVGTVALEFSNKPKTRHKVLLIGRYVLATTRGTGAGSALLTAAVRYAESRDGSQSMVLTVTEGNAPAIRLYESFGFQQFGIEPMAILTPNGYKAKVHMWRKLQDLTHNPKAQQ